MLSGGRPASGEQDAGNGSAPVLTGFGYQVAGPPVGVLDPGPVWHCSVAAGSLPIRSVLEREAVRQLAGVGDASRGEWHESDGRFFHVRRRLSEAEERQTGPALDIRRTPEAVSRALRLGPLLRFVPPEVIAEEIETVSDD